MDRVMAQEMTAYFIDRTVSLTKQCLGITLITSRFVGKDFSWSASPFKPLSCTPSMSIATGEEEVSVTTGAGMATAMFNVRGRKALLALVRVPAAEVVRAGADTCENDEWVVKALVVPQVEQRATAEAVAAAVAFILVMLRLRRFVRLLRALTRSEVLFVYFRFDGVGEGGVSDLSQDTFMNVQHPPTKQKKKKNGTTYAIKKKAPRGS